VPFRQTLLWNPITFTPREFYKMTNQQLSKALNDIAAGVLFSGDALLEAKNHPVVTINDRHCINRFLYGKPDIADVAWLKNIAFYISE
jgi:hypothetical protein